MFPADEGPKQKCLAILMTEDDGDIECQGCLTVVYGYCVGGHKHSTPEGRLYRW